MHKIKKLSAELLSEKITLDLVNSIDMINNFSPVQIEKDDKPVKLLPCSKGFWVLYDGSNILRDSKNLSIVFSEKACRIGRARYLINFGGQEKARKVMELIQTWKAQVQTELDKIKNKIDEMEDFTKDADTSESNLLVTIIKSQNPSRYEVMCRAYKDQLLKIKPAYQRLLNMQSEDRIVDLLQYFKIKEFNNPMFSAKTDDEYGMRVIKNTFGAKALKKWDGNMTQKYAEIEIEKQYPV